MLVVVGSMMTAATARGESHQVCLDFELGPQLFDASPRPPSGDTCVGETLGTDCDPSNPMMVPGVEPWEQCNASEECVPKIPDFGEDYGRWEGERPFSAKRWLFRVKDAGSDEVLWGWEPLDDNGCTGTFDDDTLQAQQGVAVTDLTLEWTRWSVSPQGHSVLGYTCTLNGGSSTADGECGELQIDEVTLELGENSAACGGGTETVDYCTLHTVGELDLQPIMYNLWATTFADSRINFSDPTQAYLLQETDASNSATTSSGSWMGGHPSIRFHPDQWRSKFTAAHEYGHLAWFEIPNAQGSHPSASGDIDYTAGMSAGHRMDSGEWQAAAAVEGFAHAAALATWNDLSQDDVVYLVDVPFSGAGIAMPIRIIHPKTGGPGSCINPTCGIGMANEWHWGIAVRQFLRPPSPFATLEDVAGMLSAVHGSVHAMGAMQWYPNGADNDFGNDFDATMDTYLTGSLYGEWADLAAYWELYEVDP